MNFGKELFHLWRRIVSWQEINSLKSLENICFEWSFHKIFCFAWNISSEIRLIIIQDQNDTKHMIFDEYFGWSSIDFRLRHFNATW